MSAADQDRCPSCSGRLLSEQGEKPAMHCDQCGGVLITWRQFIARSGEDLLLEVRTLNALAVLSPRNCAECHTPMRSWKVTAPHSNVAVEIDSCTRCEVLWFDAYEIARIREASPSSWTPHDQRRSILYAADGLNGVDLIFDLFSGA